MIYWATNESPTKLFTRSNPEIDKPGLREKVREEPIRLREQPPSAQYQPLYTANQPRLQSTYVDYVWGQGGCARCSCTCRRCNYFLPFEYKLIRSGINHQQPQVVRALTCVCRRVPHAQSCVHGAFSKYCMHGSL